MADPRERRRGRSDAIDDGAARDRGAMRPGPGASRARTPVGLWTGRRTGYILG